jgi:hypothetical protein
MESNIGIERITDVVKTRRVKTPGFPMSVDETKRVEAHGY